MQSKPKVVSLFTGAGGIDIGFEKAGFDIVLAVDNWEPACDTITINNPNRLVLFKDIRGIDFHQVQDEYNLGNIDVVIGGPPCPPYSKSRFYLKNKKRALEDENSYALAEYFRALEELKPTVFFFENVHGFAYKPHKDALDYLINRSRQLDYNISYKVINAANYGVPQIRERFICIGVKRGLPPFQFPSATHYDPLKFDEIRDSRKPWVNCKDAIGNLDFELPEDSQMQAGSKHKDLLKQIPPGDNYLYFTEKRGYPNPEFKWRSRYWSFLLKLAPEKPSWTIQASHSNNMGPFHWKNRFLRISEIKRIQTFDDTYQLVGNYNTQWRLVGNAVPPLVAKVFADAIYLQLFNSNSDQATSPFQLELSGLKL